MTSRQELRPVVDSLRMAVGTLTAIPVAPPSTVTPRVAGGAMLLAPVAALPLAAAAGVVVLAGSWLGLPALVTAVLAVGVVALGSRGLHLDGLADTADGLGASYDRKRALEVMRRGDVGPMGAVALVLVLAGQIAALAGAIAASHGVFAAVVGVLAGRLALVAGCVDGIPAARRDGLGSTVAGSVAPWQAACVIVGGTVLAGLGGLLAGLPVWLGAVAAALAVGCAAVLFWRCVARLGGVTGDVLGAGVEIGALGAFVALAV